MEMKQFKSKTLKYLFITIIIVYLVASFFIMNAIYHRYYDQEKQSLIELAESARTFMNHDDIKSLEAHFDDTLKPEYQYLKTNLINLKESKNTISFAYLMKQVNDRIVFLVDSESVDSEDYSYPGQIFYEASPIDYEPYINKQTVVTPETQDRWGLWISVLVPIIDDNEVIAVLGLDFDANHFKQEILNQTFNYFYVLISLLILMIAYYILLQKNIKLRSLSKQLIESEGLFKGVFEQSPIGIATMSSKRQMSRVNPSFIAIVERTNQEQVGKNWRFMTHPDDLKREEVLFNAFLKKEINQYEIEKRLMGKDGQYFWVRVKISSLDLSDSEDFSYICLIEDISEHKKISEALFETERSKSVLLSHIPGLAYRCKNDEQWTMEFVSDGCLELTGYEPDELINNRVISFKEIIDTQYREVLRKQWEQVLGKHENFRAEYQIITKSNEVKWVLELAQGIYDQKGNVIALEGIVIDITQTKLRDAQIRYMDDHDFLTGLYNRKYFEIEKVRFNQESYCPLSVLVGDINGVRLINDTYGYSEGDRLIVDAARILKSTCDTNSILFRTGGDEFIVLLPNTSESKMGDLVRRINHQCELYNQNSKNRSIELNLSLGSATRNHMSQSIEKVIHQAMESLNKNKILESKSYHSSILSSIQATMFAKSQNTEEHAERLALLCQYMGEKLDLTQVQMDELKLFAMLHDIGKIGIDDQILNKPSKLNNDEWNIMKKHTEIGYRIALSSPELHSIANYILTHHEHWNGEGYPQGLKGDEIPLLSRILSLVDAYDAMTQDRVYRKAISKEDAMVEIIRNRGIQFDPELTDLFIDILKEQTDL